MTLKKSLYRNSLASFLSKVSLLAIRLVQVPLFISTMGVKEYGYWIVLSSLPSWLAISNLGFGSVAANEMSMDVAAGRIGSAKKMFSSALILIAMITIIGILIVSSVCFLIPLQFFNNIGFNRSTELRLAIIYLSASVFVSFFGEIYGGRFRAANKAHQSMIISSIRPWLELGCIAIVLHFTHRFDLLALVSLNVTIIYAAVNAFFSRLAIPQLFFSFVKPNFSDFGKLFKKGMAFQAFPFGNALQFQGNILVIEAILGPSAVVLFSTARTLVRSINQVMEMINQVVWPQFSLLLGAQNYESARKLHRTSVFVSLFISLMCILPLSIFGVSIYKLWTGTAIPLSQALFFLFLLPIPFNALWFTSSVVHVACNEHEGLALRYLIACSLSLLACLVLSQFFGINGGAISTIFADMVLIPYVFSKSLILTHDNWGEFIKGTLNTLKLFFKSPSAFIASIR